MNADLRTALRLAAWLALAAPAGLGEAAAQGLPGYAPHNPLAARRSGLATQPWVDPGRTWQFAVGLDYGSIIEYAVRSQDSVLLDAEVLRLQATVTRRLGPRGFLLADVALHGAYDGFLDGFLDWYHNLFGFDLPARELRPRNQLGYALALPGGTARQYDGSRGFLGDLRVGAGLRHSGHWQSALSVTLPTGNGPAGYRRGRPSFNLTTLVHAGFAKGRMRYEGTLSGGFTPRHGDLAAEQHALFLMVTQGLRARLVGPLHAYTNLIYHSPYYKDTSLDPLDRRELTVDLGGMLRFARGPEWTFGLTEDLEPRGPAVDVVFRLGARW